MPQTGRNRVSIQKSFQFLIPLVFIVGAVVLVRDTVAQGQDFEVFWMAARSVLDGVSPYSAGSAAGMVFKYPPWILPAFFPFALFPLTAAKWAWGVLEILALGSVIHQLRLMNNRTNILLLLGIFFWGIWAVHALDGQVEIPLLALVLWSVRNRKKTSALSILVWALSTKIFTLFALFGTERRDWGSKKIGLMLCLFLALSFPVLICSPGQSIKTVASDWFAAAGSGGEMLAGEKVRGRENQGFPALVMRAIDVPAKEKQKDLIAFVALASLLGVFWWRISRGLPYNSRFMGWLGLAAAAHPLAWIHLFVFAFPLAVVTLNRFTKWREFVSFLPALLGLVFLTLVSRKTLGSTGLWLELVSVRSWGVLLLCLSLVRRSPLDVKRELS